ncbi:MAG: hypothetical protein DRH32_04635 [Deltaproteobacteria bacterium]|nr:MAG: hypothetical protein DRH32_04635 [Deltaproteobacteria bacterium]
MGYVLSDPGMQPLVRKSVIRKFVWKPVFIRVYVILNQSAVDPFKIPPGRFVRTRPSLLQGI